MKFPIGFHAAAKHTTDHTPTPTPDPKPVTPVPSLVRVHFPARNRAYSYYNDAFDLHWGDVVYVEGKLAGLRGRVVDVSYNFKIKRSNTNGSCRWPTPRDRSVRLRRLPLRHLRPPRSPL